MTGPAVASPLRLFLFPPGSGGGGGFARWDRWLPAWCQAVVVAPPGGLHTEDGQPRFGDLAELARAVAAGLDRDRPYALFGHSAGAALAWQVTRELLAAGAEPPRWLGLSACAPVPPDLGPGVVSPARPVRSAELGPLLARMAGPTAADPAHWAAPVPTLLEEFRLFASWQPTGPRRPVPVSVLTGTADPLYPGWAVRRWEQLTVDPPRYHWFTGGHTYWRDHRALLPGTVAADLAAALGGTDG